MKNIYLGKPQIDLLFQAYFIGMLIGHIPVFFDGIGLVTLFLKFAFSLPVITSIYFLYRWKFQEVNLHPYIWGFILFIVSLFLVILMYLILFYLDNRIDIRILYAFLLLAAPSSFISCVYFALRMRMRIKGSAGAV